MNNKIKKMTILSIIFILIDQITKLIVPRFQNFSIGFFHIEDVHNTGIAFGINSSNMTNLCFVIIALAMIINFVYHQKERLDNRTTIALALVISGGIGNLIDRIFRGSIVDFVGIGNFPIFNLADAFLVIGWFLLIISVLIIFNRDMKLLKNDKK